MNRAYISIAAHDVGQTSDAELFGKLAARLPFALEPAQRTAWEFQIQHLRELAAQLPDAHFFLEFLIPWIGRRADLIVIANGIIFVAEYKLGAHQFDRSSLDQVYGYGLDLKHFLETSHTAPIVPILVASHAPDTQIEPLRWDEDGLARPLRVNADGLGPAIQEVGQLHGRAPIDPSAWEAGRYRPTPTIVEAAQALYRGHDVEEISRPEAGAVSFFSSLKREGIRRRTYKAREEARQDMFDYVELFYNPVHKQIRNGMLSPAEFERQQIVKAEGV